MPCLLMDPIKGCLFTTQQVEFSKSMISLLGPFKELTQQISADAQMLSHLPELQADKLMEVTSRSFPHVPANSSSAWYVLVGVGWG